MRPRRRRRGKPRDAARRVVSARNRPDRAPPIRAGRAGSIFKSLRQDRWKLIIAASVSFMFGYPVFCKLDSLVTHDIRQYGGVYVADLRAMADFNLDQIDGQTSDIPLAFRKLDGKRVELAGQMWCPLDAAGQVRSFDLCYSITNCCFRGPPQTQHFVHVSVPPGAAVRPMQGIVCVTGTLHVEVERSGGAVISVYRMDAERVSQR